MKKRIIFAAAVIATVLIVTIIAFAGPTSPQENDKNEDIESTKYSYMLDGDTLTIVLYENPTTGFTWNYTISDQESLIFKSDEYTADSDTLLGSGGTHEFVFEVTRETDNEIIFEYYRSFDPDNVEDEYVFSISFTNGEAKVEVIQ